MTKKEFGRCIAFCLVVCVVLCMLCDLFEQSNTQNFDQRFFNYRNLNEDTVDVVWIGTSGGDRYWIAPKAYEKNGITLYTLTTDAMPTWLFVDVIEEAYSYQNPEFILVDMRAYGQANDKANAMGARARRVLDAMDFFSANRIRTAFTTMRVIHETIEEEPRFNLSFLLPYIKYHTIWQEDDYLISKHWGNKEHAYLGYYMNSTLSIQSEIVEKVVYDPEYYIELDPVAEASLYDLLAYAQTNNITLLFVDTPHFKSEQELGRSNSLIRILEEEGVSYINFCDTDENGDFIYDMNLDPETDFYNDGHVNFYGAEKFTEFFATYLDEHYDLPDRRGDPAVQEQWDGIYAKIQKRIAKWEEAAASKK